MAFRAFTVEVVIADDSNLNNVSFRRKATAFQTKDLEAAAPTVRIAPADSEATISIGTVTTGYAVAIFADYPVKVRLNGAAETQFTMRSNNVAAVNVGAPLPAQCVFIANIDVTSIRLTPIASAAQTANVWIAVTGDPTSAYT